MAPAIIITCVLGVVVVGIYLWMTPSRDTRSGFELPIFVLVFLLFGAAANLIWGPNDTFPATVVSGLLIAGSALFGLVFNAAVARQTEMRQRQEKKDDIRRAVRAEIEDYVLELERGASKRKPQGVDAAFAQDADFVPFLITARRDRVFSTVLQQIEALDDRQVEGVVRFYALHDKIVDLSDRMRGEQYANLPTARRKAVLKSLNEMEDTLYLYGLQALATLGNIAAQEKMRVINSKDQGHSDREPAA